MSSNVSTPSLEPSTTAALAAPSPSPLGSSPPLTAMDDIPPLSLDVLTEHDDKVDALKLVADSVAQQRQWAALNLIFHPVTLPFLIAVLAYVYHYTWVVKNRDLGLLLMFGSAAIMTYLVAIRWPTSKYIHLAEDLKWDYVVNEDGEEDTVIGTKYGNDMIGALVLRLEPSTSSTPAGRKKSRAASLKGGKGVIRAWTTRLKYRKRGIGSDMLHEAVKVTRDKCGKDAEVGFAKEHANSTMFLPELFNGPFRKQERKAAKALDTVLADWDGNKRKR